MRIVCSVPGKHIGRVVRTIRMRGFRPAVALVSVLLVAAPSVDARPVVISEVTQTIGRYQNPPDLRLRGFTVTNETPVVASAFPADGSFTDTSQTIVPQYSDSLLSGVAIGTPDPQARLDTIAQGDIQGTICDCGEIILPDGLPKWPLLFLAAIPLFFIDEGDEIEIITPVPTPTPTPTPTVPVPEPTSVFLFGSGLLALGASFRRRYGKRKLAAQADTTEEG